MIAAVVAVAGTTAVGVAGASGSSGAATDVTIYAIEDVGTFCFSLNQTTCSGELTVPVSGATSKVTWAFPGPYTQPHNARAVSGNWTYKSHDPSTSTDPNDIQDPDYEFTTNGTYEFVCDVHAGFMKGKIVVTGAAEPTSTATATATPTVSATPTPPPGGGQPTTPPPAGGGTDLVKPTLRSIGAKGKRRVITVRFRLSENATVTVRVKRGRKTIKRVTTQMAAGTRTLKVRSAKLRIGRYKVEVRARDASGNFSTLASKTLRIRR